MMQFAPCHRMGDLFFATERELKHPETSDSYRTAVDLCNNTCTERKDCAEVGVKFADRHTVRAGLRLWIGSERALLPAIATGESP